MMRNLRDEIREEAWGEGLRPFKSPRGHDWRFLVIDLLKESRVAALRLHVIPYKPSIQQKWIHLGVTIRNRQRGHWLVTMLLVRQMGRRTAALAL